MKMNNNNTVIINSKLSHDQIWEKIVHEVKRTEKVEHGRQTNIRKKV